VVYSKTRGTAIVDSPNGVLVVTGNEKTYYLPGGRARPGESCKMAAIRELNEETGLIATDTTYLFDYEDSDLRKDRKGDFFRDSHKVFQIESIGKAVPKMEITSLTYFNGSNARISRATRKILEKYYVLKNPQIRHTDTRCSNCGAKMVKDQLSANVKCEYCGAILSLGAHAEATKVIIS
jgi:ADP-ribose pyrophosphatase YjhB (NUDIX family)